MERTDVGKGRFLITRTPGELQELNISTEISMHLGLVALSASQKELSTDPIEIQMLDNDIKRHYEIIDRLMSTFPTPQSSEEPISETERLNGGIKHAFINGEISFDEAEARLKLIAELNASDHSPEDK